MQWVTAGLGASATLVAPWALIFAASEAFGPAPTFSPEQAREAREADRLEPAYLPSAVEVSRWAFGEAPEEPARPDPFVLSETPAEEVAPPEPAVEEAPPVGVAPPVPATTARPPAPAVTLVAARGNSA